MNSQEHYVALAGSLDREAETRLEQEPGVESKAKKLTRSDSVNHDEDDDYDDYDCDDYCIGWDILSGY